MHELNNNSSNKIECLVCGSLTIDNRGRYEICPVCFWEDEGEISNPDSPTYGPNGDLSLVLARQNYQEYGAVEEKFTTKVKFPPPGEVSFTNKLVKLGFDVEKEEFNGDKSFSLYFSLKGERIFELFIDVATSAWLRFRDVTEGSDEVNSRDRWEALFQGFNEIVESLYERSFTEISYMKNEIKKGGYVEYQLSDGKTRRITDMKLHFFGIGKKKEAITLPPLKEF